MNISAYLRWLPISPVLAILLMPHGALATPRPTCEALKNVSATIRRADDEINNPPAGTRGTPAYSRIYSKADSARRAVQWPFSFDGPEAPYVFKAADFDRDGQIDKITSACGDGDAKICVLTFDRGDGKPHVLQKGFMYLTRVRGHFFVVWDYYALPGAIKSGGPKVNRSQYYRVTSQGFSEVCKSNLPLKHDGQY